MSIDSGTNANRLNGVFANIAESLPTYDASGQVTNIIDGHILNTMTGVSTQSAGISGGVVEAVETVSVNVGDLSTTVLGAVNTGEITVGTNQTVSEAVADASSAISNAITQAGGSAEFTTLQLNIASNQTQVLGSVTNELAALDGTIGNTATTVLGAVNTGTITSGVDATVSGTISGIIGG